MAPEASSTTGTSPRDGPYPPKDYARWGELVYQWTRHCIERYGKPEVETWYFEVWNEPNLAGYWRSTPEDFERLHDFAVAAVRRALPTARVGGPDVAGSGAKFMEGFLRHVTAGTNYATGETGTPTDFVSFHAKGSPVFIDGHVRMGIAAQLKTVDAGFSMIAAVPELRSKPIVIGESDPEGCAACQGPQMWLLSQRNRVLQLHRGMLSPGSATSPCPARSEPGRSVSHVGL